MLIPEEIVEKDNKPVSLMKKICNHSDIFLS